MTGRRERDKASTIGNQPADRGTIGHLGRPGREGEDVAVFKQDRLDAAVARKIRMGGEMTPFAMYRHGIARLHQAVEPPEFVARGMAGDVHDMIHVRHQMHATADEIVLHGADRTLVAGDHAAGENDRVAFTQNDAGVRIHRHA